MTKFITVEMMETDLEISFQVSEQFIELWQKCAGSIDPELNSTADDEFEKLVDTVYATLTHEQKKALFAEAIDLHKLTLQAKQDTGYCYEISARKHLHMCIGFSILDYLEEFTA